MARLPPQGPPEALCELRVRRQRPRAAEVDAAGLSVKVPHAREALRVAQPAWDAKNIYSKNPWKVGI